MQATAERKEIGGGITTAHVFLVDGPMDAVQWIRVLDSRLPFWTHRGAGEWVYRVRDGAVICRIEEL